MNLIIDDNTKLHEIQSEFCKHFPFLRLNFFGFELLDEKIVSKNNLILDTQRTLGEIRHLHVPGNVSMNGHQKVRTFENNFRENFGVNVQVLRKSANAWLVTTATDDWTLAEQNKMGKEMNNPVKEQAADFDEYHEQL